jgi:hypothetical protein
LYFHQIYTQIITRCNAGSANALIREKRNSADRLCRIAVRERLMGL